MTTTTRTNNATSKLALDENGRAVFVDNLHVVRSEKSHEIFFTGKVLVEFHEALGILDGR